MVDAGMVADTSVSFVTWQQGEQWFRWVLSFSIRWVLCLTSSTRNIVITELCGME